MLESPKVIVFEYVVHLPQARLLAAFGVGTVDQVLMAALSGKHVFVSFSGWPARL
jgi:hypothetical protein